MIVYKDKWTKKLGNLFDKWRKYHENEKHSKTLGEGS